MKERLNEFVKTVSGKTYKEEMIFWSSSATDNVDFNTKKILADGICKVIQETLSSFDKTIDLHISFDKNISKKKSFFSVRDVIPSLKILSEIYSGLEDAVTDVYLTVGQHEFSTEVKFNEYHEPGHLKNKIQSVMKLNAKNDKGPFRSLEYYISNEKDGNGIILKFSAQNTANSTTYSKESNSLNTIGTV